MDYTKDQVVKFETNIKFMENLIQVYTWESCNKIRAYLAIEGKMRASEISKCVGLEGDKSVYKSLNRLLDSGLIAKELEEGSSRNAYYYATSHNVIDPDFDAAFISYLVIQNKYQLIADYITAANQASMGFLQVVTELLATKLSNTSELKTGEVLMPDTLFYESIISIENPQPLLQKIEQVFQEEIPKYRLQNHDPKQGIPYPAAMYFAFVPLSQAK